jgi:hypothetical protein
MLSVGNEADEEAQNTAKTNAAVVAGNRKNACGRIFISEYILSVNYSQKSELISILFHSVPIDVHADDVFIKFYHYGKVIDKQSDQIEFGSHGNSFLSDVQ